MRLIIQRIKNATLSVDGKVVSSVNNGLMVLCGVCQGDTMEQVKKSAYKIANLRIFEDENQKLNLSVLDKIGEILLVSNFTLCTIESTGNRPSFIYSADKETANNLYLELGIELNNLGVPTKLGVFGADMQIDAHLDGPITIYKEIK